MATTKIITEVTDLNAASSTNGLKMPTGGAYSGTPTDGMVRNDTTGSSQGSASTMQHYNGTEWKNYENLASTFTTDYLVVAGGGGSGAGGNTYANTGGGGGGGLLYGTNYELTSGTQYTITVGAGGAGGVSGYTDDGKKGVNSVFNSFTAIGGGGSSAFAGSRTYVDGGSGAGGAGYTNVVNGTLAGSGTSGQGNSGGNGDGSNPIATRSASGGGGGAQQSGTSGLNGNAGNGGNGTQISITGTSLYYAGGGGGSGETTAGTAGLGGGGAGRGGTTSLDGTNGTPNTGGGAGGAGGGTTAATRGGQGGSGIVILRYPTADVSSYAVTGTLDTVADTAYPVTNLAYYKLEGGSGTTVTDSSGNVYNGTATSVTYAAGRFGQAAVFNGNNSKIDVGNQTWFDSDFTLSMWFYPSDPSGTTVQMLATKRLNDDGTSPLTMFLNETSRSTNPQKIAFSIGGGPGTNYNYIYTSNTYNLNSWNHAAVKISGTSMSLTLNGTETTTTFTGTRQTNSETIRFGNKYGTDGDYPLNGKIDQIRIFNTALSAANVTSLYNEGTVVESTDGTDSILQFIGGTGTVTFS